MSTLIGVISTYNCSCLTFDPNFEVPCSLKQTATGQTEELASQRTWTAPAGSPSASKTIGFRV